MRIHWSDVQTKVCVHLNSIALTEEDVTTFESHFHVKSDSWVDHCSNNMMLATGRLTDEWK